MRIQCPFCGERDVGEFTYLGDAGAHAELWYHAYGCRGWLRVMRNTLTHEVLAVAFAGAIEAKA